MCLYIGIWAVVLKIIQALIRLLPYYKNSKSSGEIQSMEHPPLPIYQLIASLVNIMVSDPRKQTVRRRRS